MCLGSSFRQRTWEHQGMMTSLNDIILNKEHARSDDGLHILQVNSEAYYIQKGAWILTFMFCTSGRPKTTYPVLT
jgi:hypothetical protein